MSIGVAEFPYDANSVETLIEMSDQALYHAKHQGRNRAVRYYAEMKHGGEEKMTPDQMKSCWLKMIRMISY